MTDEPITKIKKIKCIKNVRNFTNLESDIELSIKRNVVYAPNGMGKTNLSRIFHCLTLRPPERQELLTRLKSLEASQSSDVEIHIEDTAGVDCNNQSYIDNILVYNCDYLEANIRCPTFSKGQEISGLLEVDLGESQIALAELESKKLQLEKDLKKIKAELELKLQLEIEEISSWDPRGSKHREQLKHDNLSIKTYEDFKKEEADYKKAKENFDVISQLDPDKDKLGYTRTEISHNIDLQWIVKELSEGSVFETPASDELKKHIQKITNEWIEDGLRFLDNDNGKCCPFCRQDLQVAKGVITKYREHIASKEAEFKKKIQIEIDVVLELIRSVGAVNNENKSNFETRCGNLGENMNWENLNKNTLLELLIGIFTSLELKKTLPELSFSNYSKSSAPPTPVDLLCNELNLLNQNIKINQQNCRKIDEKLSSIATRQSELRRLIGIQRLVSVYERNAQTLDRRDNLLMKLQALNLQITNEKRKLPSVDTAEKIVTLFNLFLHKILGIAKYRAELKDQRLYLMLDSQDISEQTERISEGEKNAIGFCYFLASSIQKRNSLQKYANSIFIIDDPICSMSYKYFYSVGILVKSFFKLIQENCWNAENIQGSPQVILFTHNIQFYNLLSSQLFKEHPRDRKNVFLELEKNDQRFRFREIDPVEKLSEFHTSLRRIKGVRDGALTENIGNDIRRVLETLCNFYGCSLTSENMKKIFGNEKDIPELFCFAQDKSHSDLNEHEDPNPENYRNAATNLLKLMNNSFSELIDNLPNYNDSPNVTLNQHATKPRGIKPEKGKFIQAVTIANNEK